MPNSPIAPNAAAPAPVTSTLEACDGRLPRDRTPHVLRFSQWLLFADARPPGGDRPRAEREFLVLQRHLLGPGGAPPQTKLPWLDDLAKEFAGSLRVTAALASGKLPAVDAPLAKLRGAAQAEGIPGYKANLAEQPVRTLYGQWLRTEQAREAALWTRWSGVAGLGPLAPPASLADLQGPLRDVVFAPPFAPLCSPQAHFALCAVYEQQWTPLGYTRGDLVGSISLAPGETVTLEVHSWDKTVFKTENELNEESELRLSAKSTLRDTAEVVDEMSAQSGSKLTREFSLSLPVPTGEIPLAGSASAGAEMTAELSEALKSTVNRTSERTEEAASSLKNQRKTRIELTRDSGRESKQTRVLVNTNRGRTLNCHYFEIMANYRVETRLVELRPCLLLPYPRQRLTRRWVLSHEFVLRQALLDASFLPGFEAAHTLELAEALAVLQAPSAPNSGASSEAACARARDAILVAATALEMSVQDAIAAMTKRSSLLAMVGGPRAYGAVVLAHLQGDRVPLQRLLYGALLAAGDKALPALEQLRTAGHPASAALETFFAAVKVADFSPPVSAARASDGLRLRGLAAALAERFIFGGILDDGPDDAGLAAAVGAAVAWAQPASAPPTTGGRPVARAAAASESGSPTKYLTGTAKPLETLPLTQLAEATVEYQRLADHLQEYAPHYQQAVWLRTHPDERARFLRAQGLALPIVSEEILGFEDDKAIHPLTDLAAVKKFLDFEKLTKDVRASSIAPQTTHLSLPTPGTVLESLLGQCDALEDYIVQSRALELRQKAAEAAQDEAEVERRRQRLGASPPELGEFHPAAPCDCDSSAEGGYADPNGEK